LSSETANNGNTGNSTADDVLSTEALNVQTTGATSIEADAYTYSTASATTTGSESGRLTNESLPDLTESGSYGNSYTSLATARWNGELTARVTSTSSFVDVGLNESSGNQESIGSSFTRETVRDSFLTASTRQTTFTEQIQTTIAATSVGTSNIFSGTVVNDAATITTTQASVTTTYFTAISTTRVGLQSQAYSETGWSYVDITEASTANYSESETRNDTTTVTFTVDDGNGGTATSSEETDTVVTDTFSSSAVTESSSQGFSFFPTAATATVVVLSITEAGYLTLDTEFDAWSARLTEAFSGQSVSQFTVYPSIRTFEGGTSESETSSEQQTETTVYSVLTDSSATTSVGSYPNTILFPTPTVTRTVAVKSANTVEQTLFTNLFTGSTQATTVFTTSTHNAQLGTMSWEQSHHATTATETTVNVATYLSNENTSTVINEGDSPVSNSVEATINGATGRTLQYQRTEPFAANLNDFAVNPQSTAAVAFNTAVAAIGANVTGLQISLDGMTVSAPTQAANSTWWTQQSRTIFYPPIGSWTYSQSSSTYTYSADAAGLTQFVLSASGSVSQTESSSAAWNIQGPTPTKVNLADSHVINAGGRAADGNDMTVWRLPGFWMTSNGSTSGTFEATTAETLGAGVDFPRTAYSRMLVALASSSGLQYFTTAHHTAVIQESALIL
jgi:hypothetical protein